MTFLVIGLLLVLAACVVKLFSPKAKPTEVGLPPTPGAIDSFYTKIRGVTFNNDDGVRRQKIIDQCSIGEDLILVPEPTCQFDPGAVKICRKNGDMLGYWHAQNGQMADSLASGQRYRVRIARIYPFKGEREGEGHGVALFVEHFPEVVEIRISA